MGKEFKIEKSIQEQIIVKMILKLKDNEHFNESILKKLKTSDLSKKNDVIQIISEESNNTEDEST